MRSLATLLGVVAMVQSAFALLHERARALAPNELKKSTTVDFAQRRIVASQKHLGEVEQGSDQAEHIESIQESSSFERGNDQLLAKVEGERTNHGNAEQELQAAEKVASVGDDPFPGVESLNNAFQGIFEAAKTVLAASEGENKTAAKAEAHVVAQTAKMLKDAFNGVPALKGIPEAAWKAVAVLEAVDKNNASDGPLDLADHVQAAVNGIPEAARNVLAGSKAADSNSTLVSSIATADIREVTASNIEKALAEAEGENKTDAKAEARVVAETAKSLKHAFKFIPALKGIPEAAWKVVAALEAVDKKNATDGPDLAAHVQAAVSGIPEAASNVMAGSKVVDADAEASGPVATIAKHLHSAVRGIPEAVRSVKQTASLLLEEIETFHQPAAVPSVADSVAGASQNLNAAFRGIFEAGRKVLAASEGEDKTDAQAEQQVIAESAKNLKNALHGIPALKGIPEAAWKVVAALEAVDKNNATDGPLDLADHVQAAVSGISEAARNVLAGSKVAHTNRTAGISEGTLPSIGKVLAASENETRTDAKVEARVIAETAKGLKDAFKFIPALKGIPEAAWKVVAALEAVEKKNATGGLDLGDHVQAAVNGIPEAAKKVFAASKDADAEN